MSELLSVESESVPEDDWPEALMPDARATAATIERLATELHGVAFDFLEPACTHREAERRIAEVERICTEARAAVRGHSPVNAR